MQAWQKWKLQGRPSVKRPGGLLTSPEETKSMLTATASGTDACGTFPPPPRVAASYNELYYLHKTKNTVYKTKTQYDWAQMALWPCPFYLPFCREPPDLWDVLPFTPALLPCPFALPPDPILGPRLSTISLCHAPNSFFPPPSLPPPLPWHPSPAKLLSPQQPPLLALTPLGST